MDTLVRTGGHSPVHQGSSGTTRASTQGCLLVPGSAHAGGRGEKYQGEISPYLLKKKEGKIKIGVGILSALLEAHDVNRWEVMLAVQITQQSGRRCRCVKLTALLVWGEEAAGDFGVPWQNRDLGERALERWEMHSDGPVPGRNYNSEIVSQTLVLLSLSGVIASKISTAKKNW